MAEQKQYSSVSEVIGDLAPDDSLSAELEARIASRKLIKYLLGLRAVKGLSQQDVAKEVGCSQSRISKLENAKDDDVRLGDLKAYAEAVGCDFVAHPIPRDMKPTDKVKYCAVAMKENMDKMAQLARSDEKIAEGVASFFLECYVNVILMLGESAKRLPLRPDASPYFKIDITTIENDASDPACCIETEDDPQVAVS